MKKILVALAIISLSFTAVAVNHTETSLESSESSRTSISTGETDVLWETSFSESSVETEGESRIGNITHEGNEVMFMGLVETEGSCERLTHDLSMNDDNTLVLDVSTEEFETRECSDETEYRGYKISVETNQEFQLEVNHNGEQIDIVDTEGEPTPRDQENNESSTEEPVSENTTTTASEAIEERENEPERSNETEQNTSQTSENQTEDQSVNGTENDEAAQSSEISNETTIPGNAEPMEENHSTSLDDRQERNTPLDTLAGLINSLL